MNTVYILYYWGDATILYSTYDREKMYAHVGELAERREYSEDMHIIKINLDEAEK